MRISQLESKASQGKFEETQKPLKCHFERLQSLPIAPQRDAQAIPPTTGRNDENCIHTVTKREIQSNGQKQNLKKMAGAEISKQRAKAGSQENT